MNVLPFDRKVHVLTALVEGNSIRATGRICEVNRETVMHLGVDAGEACRRLHDALVVGIQVGVLEVDEIWSFIAKKHRRLRTDDNPDFGDCYTFLGLDANRKAIISYVVGKRDGAHAIAFCRDLRARILNRPQITSDGFAPYVDAVRRAFGDAVDYAQILKTYGTATDANRDRRYGPHRCTSSVKVPIAGAPARENISTSYVERLNLTLRMSAKRFARLSLGFSKKLRNHAAAVALNAAHYNFCRVHESLRVTPMMALGVTNHVWSVAELLDVALSYPPVPAEAPSFDPGQVACPADLPAIVPALPGPQEAPESSPNAPVRLPEGRLAHAVAMVHQLSLFPESEAEASVPARHKPR